MNPSDIIYEPASYERIRKQVRDVKDKMDLTKQLHDRYLDPSHMTSSTRRQYVQKHNIVAYLSICLWVGRLKAFIYITNKSIHNGLEFCMPSVESILHFSASAIMHICGLFLPLGMI